MRWATKWMSPLPTWWPTSAPLAHEELGRLSQLHWSIPDPVRVGTTPAFDTAYEEIENRVTELASQFPVAS